MTDTATIEIVPDFVLNAQRIQQLILTRSLKEGIDHPAVFPNLWRAEDHYDPNGDLPVCSLEWINLNTSRFISIEIYADGLIDCFTTTSTSDSYDTYTSNQQKTEQLNIKAAIAWVKQYDPINNPTPEHKKSTQTLQGVNK